MTRRLDLDDIQGNIVRPYGKFGYPKARYLFLNFTNAWVGREFLRRVLDADLVTSARPWPKREVDGETMRVGPPVTFNIGFTFLGLYTLDLPVRTLQGFPHEFVEGMRARAFILGDEPASGIDPKTGDLIASPLPARDSDPSPEWMARWDPIWKENRSRFGSADVHIWISLNARVEPMTETVVAGESGRSVLDERCEWIERSCAEVTAAYAKAHGGDDRGVIRILPGNGPDGALWQDSTALFDDFTTADGRTIRLPVPTEHFGFTDGIGDPVFEGQFDEEEMAARVKGRGKWMSPERAWEPIATGEFLLGFPDESQELPPCPRPVDFSRNGSFMVYRKLHQNVAAFRDYFAEEAKRYAAASGKSVEEAEVTLKAKAIGRWPDGVPLSKAPDFATWMAARKRLPVADGELIELTDEKTVENYRNIRRYLKSPHPTDFKYGDDMQGHATPLGAHLRRVNTRDHLDPLLDVGAATVETSTTALNKRRRILRRGLPYGPSTQGGGSDETEQGVIMMTLCSSIFRQYEFVQQQWIQYGLDFNAGNSTCPLVGDHSRHKRFVVNADVDAGETPYVCNKLKTFVEPRGGEYFFIPSITALTMMANGAIDPT